MPKVIENLKENILACAKAELLINGYGALSIRGVAKSCGIAVGTMYNYFPSKDMLAAAVMLEDWVAALQSMQRACEASTSAEEALGALCCGVTAFSEIYRSVWAGCAFPANANIPYTKYHGKLVRQLADCLLPVLVRCGAADVEALSVFCAENVLICTNGSEMTFETFLRIAARLLPA